MQSSWALSCGVCRLPPHERPTVADASVPTAAAPPVRLGAGTNDRFVRGASQLATLLLTS